MINPIAVNACPLDAGKAVFRIALEIPLLNWYFLNDILSPFFFE